MDTHTDVLVANDPAAYRDMLASELPFLRPHLTVLQVDPADLEAAVVRLRPRLVVCSELTELVRQHASAWIMLYPNGANQAIVDVAGQQRRLLNPGLTDVLIAVDVATA